MGLVYDSSKFLNAARLSTVSTNNTPNYFFGPSQAYAFNANYEYTLQFSIGCANITSIQTSRVDVYLTGPAFPSHDPYGYKITSFELDNNQSFASFDAQQFTFVPLRTGTAKLRFVVWAGSWYVRNVQLISAVERGFNPDQGVLFIPIVNKRKENVQFKVDLYDVNNNLVPVTLTSQVIPIDGGNLVVRGNDNKIDGTLVIVPSGSGTTYPTSSGIVLTGNPSGGGSAIYVGNGTPGSSSTPIFIGSGGGSGNGIITIGDKLTGVTSGSTTVLNVSGTLAVYDSASAGWKDVRDVISSSSYVSGLNSQEILDQANLTASYHLNYSQSVLTASIISVSASIAQQEAANSASFAYQLTTLSASRAQSTASAGILDAFNRIIIPPSAVANKTITGLYLESSSLGYFNATQANYPSYIGSDGSFRFADATSYVGGADPYARMIGMAGGIFVVRTNALYMSASGFLLQATSSVSPAANVLMLGSVTNAAVGTGVYMDGAGTFRAGSPDPAGSQIYADATQVRINTTQLTMNAGGIYLLANPASAASNTIKVGTNASSITLNNNTGFYTDGTGNFRVGTDVSGSNYIQFAQGNSLIVKSNNFDLASSANLAGGVATLRVNTSFISLGQPAPSGFSPQTNTQGFYVDNQGQFFIGSSSYVNASAPQSQTGNFISFGGLVLNIRSSAFRFNGGGSGGGNIIIDSANNGLISLGSATSISTGPGFYADGLGNFRVGSPNGQSISWDGSNLNVKGNLSLTDGSPLVNYIGAQCNPNPYLQNGVAGYASYSITRAANVAVFSCDVNQISIDTGIPTSQLYIPNGNGVCLKIYQNPNTGTVDAGFSYIIYPDNGTWKPGNYHRGAHLIFKIVAFIPVGYQINYQSNNLSNETRTWLSSQNGTGTWQTYIFQSTIAAVPDATYGYDTIGFFNITGPAKTTQFTAYLSSCEIMDTAQGNIQSTLIQSSKLPDVTPTQAGLYMASQYLGFWNGSWNTYIASNGNFRFSGNANNYLAWDGSTFTIKANAFSLAATGLTIDSAGGKIALGSATALTTGAGVYIDSAGRFRVGDPARQYVIWDGGSFNMYGGSFYANGSIQAPLLQLLGAGSVGIQAFNNTSQLAWQIYTDAATNITHFSSGSGADNNKLYINFASMSFNGVAATSQPVVSGDWSGNAAGASLAAALANLGLIINHTTNGGSSYTPPPSDPTPPPPPNRTPYIIPP